MEALKNNKRGSVNFTSFAVGIIAMSMLALAASTFMIDLSTFYGVPINSQAYPETYNKLNEMLNVSNQIGIGVTGDTTSTGSTSDALLQQGTSAVKIAFSTIGVFKALLIDSTNALGLPWWFGAGVVAMILVILGLLAIAIITKQFIRP